VATKLDWFDDAAEYVREAAKVAPFPGEPKPVVEALEKFALKLLSECHNGKVVGMDQCPVCRAYRTEKAEATAHALIQKSEGFEAVTRKTQTELDTARADGQVWQQQAQASGVELQKVKHHAEASAVQLSQLARDVAAADARANQAEAANKVLRTSLGAANVELSAASARFHKIKTALELAAAQL
jgi:hypothetical protein